ncbi:MAG: hypothetical protein A3H32_16875 [Betaproteobacteria bacterium RIFCSPLOWO2_02_FULL_63_19]|nr:MAG: hypothetical protein A3H32_16875 [Betaproteobacteria bacterium RIFCSPLOWO2_02_FULL_63_19]
MSTGAILSVLSNIPWGQVVENAPKLADGAAKLWSKVANFRKSSRAGETDPALARDESRPSELQRLQARVLELEQSVQSLHEQMQASTELIKALADQNTQLVQRIELNRARLVRVSVGGVLIACALLATMLLLR